MRIGDLDVRGHDLLVTANLRIKSKDLGGNSSATDNAHLGYEPKSLSVSLKIKYTDADDLSALVNCAEQLDSAKKPKVYDVVDRTAAAFNIRQVRFFESVRAREDESLHQWQVSFELLEYRSVAEKIEQRQTTATAQTQQASGTTVTSTENTGANAAEQLTSFEKILAKIDKVLAQ